MSTAKDYGHAAGKGAVSGVVRVLVGFIVTAAVGGSGFGLGYATGSDDEPDQPSASENREED